MGRPGVAVTTLRTDIPLPSILLGYRGAQREQAAYWAWGWSCRAALGLWRQRWVQWYETEQWAQGNGGDWCEVPCATVTPAGRVSQELGQGH